MMTDEIPSFLAEAEALARVLAQAFDPAWESLDPAEPDVVRLLTEALEHAWLAGRETPP